MKTGIQRVAKIFRIQASAGITFRGYWHVNRTTQVMDGRISEKAGQVFHHSLPSDGPPYNCAVMDGPQGFADPVTVARRVDLGKFILE